MKFVALLKLKENSYMLYICPVLPTHHQEMPNIVEFDRVRSLNLNALELEHLLFRGEEENAFESETPRPAVHNYVISYVCGDA